MPIYNTAAASCGVLPGNAASDHLQHHRTTATAAARCTWIILIKVDMCRLVTIHQMHRQPRELHMHHQTRPIHRCHMEHPHHSQLIMWVPTSIGGVVNTHIYIHLHIQTYVCMYVYIMYTFLRLTSCLSLRVYLSCLISTFNNTAIRLIYFWSSLWARPTVQLGYSDFAAISSHSEPIL